MSKVGKVINVLTKQPLQRNATLTGSAPHHLEDLEPFVTAGYKRMKIFWEVHGVSFAGGVAMYTVDVVALGNTRNEHDSKDNWRSDLVNLIDGARPVTLPGVDVYEYDGLPEWTRLQVQILSLPPVPLNTYLGATVSITVILYEE